MEQDVQRQLLELNRSFYQQFAGQFSASRSTTQASLRRVLAMVADGASVLDVGCGDGRVARALQEMGCRATYLGIDACTDLILLARRRASALSIVAASFDVVDITHGDWPDDLPRQAFDVVLALAVLHHIPGGDLRQRIVQQMVALLAPSGRLILSTWQFMTSERLRRKIVPWATIGLDEDQVDPGDYLLDWQRGGYGVRYCHLIDEEGMRDLLRGARLSVDALFFDDNGLNLYASGVR